MKRQTDCERANELARIRTAYERQVGGMWARLGQLTRLCEGLALQLGALQERMDTIAERHSERSGNSG